MMFMYDPPQLPSFFRRGISRRSSLATISGNDAVSVHVMEDMNKP